jgi:hypothetical protein
MSVIDGKITLSVLDNETKEQEKVTLRKGEELTLGDAVYILVRIEGDSGVIAPKVEPEEPSNGGGDFGGGGGW